VQTGNLFFFSEVNNRVEQRREQAIVLGWAGLWYPEYFERETQKNRTLVCIPPRINKIQPTKYVNRRDATLRGVAALSVPVRRARILFMSCTLSLLISPIFVRSAGQNGEAQHVLTRAMKGHLVCHANSTLLLQRSIRFVLVHLCTSGGDAGI